MRFEPIKVARFLAVANLCFAAIGLALLVSVMLLIKSGRATFMNPLEVRIFWTMASINAIMLAALTVGALYIWNMRQSGVWICIMTYALEILYMPAISVLKMRFRASNAADLLRLADAVGAVAGMGSVALAPQFFTLYLF